MILIDKIIKLYKNQYVLSRSIIVIIASFLGNIFAYLFQLISGRYFSAEDYGIIVALFSLSGIIPLFVRFFINGIPKLVAELKDTDYPHKITDLFYSIFLVNSGVSIIVASFMFLGINFISNYLNIHDVPIIKSFILAVSAGILTSFMIPFLQGLLRFKAYSFLIVLGSIGKLGVIFVVVIFGLGVRGIFAGLAIITLIMGVITYKILSKNITKNWRKFDRPELSNLLRYSAGGAMAVIGLNLINSNDILLAKHFFDPETAGIYASISVIGRIIFYASSPITIVMLPICSKSYKDGHNFFKPFVLAVLLSLSISTIGVFAYWTFSHKIIKLLFGAGYLSAEPYLGIFALFMLLYSLVYIFAWFFVSISQFKLGSLVIISAILQFVGLHYFHKSISEVILVSMLSVGSVAVIYIIVFTRIYYLYWVKLQKTSADIL